MIGHGRGLIVNMLFWAAQKHIGNVAYGVSTAATDKMTADMATALRPHGVTIVSSYPGFGKDSEGRASCGERGRSTLIWEREIARGDGRGSRVWYGEGQLQVFISQKQRTGPM